MCLSIGKKDYCSPEDAITGNRFFFRTVLLSAACHIVLLGVIVVSPEFRTHEAFLPNAVKVNLVTLAEPQAPVTSAPPAPQQLEKSAPAPEPVQKEISKEVSEAKQGKKVKLETGPLQVKKSIKQKTYQADKVVKGAIEQIRKDLPQSRSKDVNAAIERLRKQVATNEQAVQGARGSAATLRAMDIYNAEIWHRIQKKWAFSSQLARGKSNLEAVIITKIMKDGRIRDLWFEERSGNRSFDDSVFRAIKKSDPFPPLPKGYAGSYYEVGIRFNLSELQKSGTHGQ